VLPGLLETLGHRAGPDHTEVGTRLHEAARSAMRKGEVLVCHVHGTGEHARIVGVERIDT
jgi:8-oxo-dGTP diphosphatase